MDATSESTSVERDIEIAASPETVWELLTDQNEATRWMGQSAEFDLRPGGVYRVEVIPGNTARGEFVEIDEPCRASHTQGWNHYFERLATVAAGGDPGVDPWTTGEMS